MDEKELFLCIQKGDIRAFELLFHQYYGVLCSSAEKMLQNAEVAEDIVQEMFSKFWAEREYIRIENSLKAFLFKWVKNRCINYLKHLSVISSYKDAVLFSNENEETEDFEEELIIAIYASIQQLPPQCQKVFKMSRFEGLKHKEIAETLGISVKTVKIHIGKALRHIKESVKKPMN